MSLQSHAVFFVLVLSVAAVVDDQPYCSLRYKRLCQGKGEHVGCQFPDAGPGEYCENYTQIKFTAEVKNFITNFINRRRQRIAAGTERVRGGKHLPKPKVMMFVEWDRELAFLAQRLADQCSFVHDECRATVKYPYAGQSVGEVRWRRSSESDELTAQRAIRRVFDAWWGERRRVMPQQLTAPFRLTAKGSVWGHFSQLAVWSLRAVGCGAVRHGSSYPRLLLVCDFSHTNMLGQRTISPGPLAPCPIHTVRRHRTAFSLLCAPVRHPFPSESEDTQADEDQFEIADDDEESFDNVQESDISNSTYGHFLKATRPAPSKSSETSRTTKSVVPTEDDYRVIGFDSIPSKATNRRVIGHLSGEMKSLMKVGKNNRLNQEGRLQNWIMRRPYTLYPRGKQEEIGLIESTTLRSHHRYALDKNQKLQKHRTITERTYETTIEALVIRHRWKHTRDRPIRPGANALLSIPTPMYRRSSVASLTLDKEDVDQLFRDTGFNPNWRKRL